MTPGRRHGPGGQGLAAAEEFGFDERDGVLRPAVRPRRRAVPARAPDHQPPELARPSGRDQGGHGHRPRDVLPGEGRLLGGADRGGGRGHGRRAAGHHARSRRPSCSWRTRTDDGATPIGSRPRRDPTLDRDPPPDCTGRWSSAGCSRRARRSCSSRGWCAARRISAIGQEAVAAGFAAAMRDDDYTFATYRGHNHALARGAPMGPLYAELFGRASGLHGRQGRLDAHHRRRATT